MRKSCERNWSRLLILHPELIAVKNEFSWNLNWWGVAEESNHKRFFYKQLTSYKIDNALNLSILLSAGKETNRDFICSGERTWNCPRFKICRYLDTCRIVVWCSLILVICRSIKWLLMNNLRHRVKFPWMFLWVAYEIGSRESSCLGLQL